jgi:hypothetical protein
MTNYFDQFDGEQAVVTLPETRKDQGNYFDQFDEKPSSANTAAPLEDMSWLDTQINRGRAVLDSVGNMVGGMVKADAALEANKPKGATGSRFAPAGGGAFVYPQDFQRLEKEKSMTPEEYKADRAAVWQEGVKTGDALSDDANFGYKNRTGELLERGKTKISEGRWLSGAADIVSGGLDGVANSAALWVPGTQGAAVGQFAGEIIDNRVKNTEDKTAPDTQDLGIGVAAGTGMMVLERWLPTRLFRAGKPIEAAAAQQISNQVVSHVAKKVISEAGKDATVEGITEALQDGIIGYVAEHYGTDAAIDFNEMARTSVDSFILGAAGGGVLGSAKGAYEGVSEAGQANDRVANDNAVDLPTSGDQVGGGIVDDIAPEQSAQETPAELEHSPDRMITMPDGTTVWESELPSLQEQQVAQQHPAYAKINESPDDIEASLNQPIGIDDEINTLLGELTHYRAEKLRQTAQPAIESLFQDGEVNTAPVNFFDQFDAPAESTGLFDNIYQAKAEDVRIAQEKEAKRTELKDANFQEDNQNGLFDEARRLVEQSRYEPIKNQVAPESIADVYPADASVNIPTFEKEKRLDLPEGVEDKRMARPEFRQKLERLSNELIKGGGVSYVRDANDNIVGRTPSLNANWFQRMNTDSEKSMSVESTQAAIQKSLSGKKLGVREMRVVGAALDEITGERDNYARQILQMRQNTKADRQAAFEHWKQATQAPDDFEFTSIITPESAGESFQEEEYLPESTMESRSVSELADIAAEMGASWKAIDNALELEDIGTQTQQLTGLIWELRNEHRQSAEPTTRTADTSTEAQGRPGTSESAITGVADQAPDTSQPTETRQEISEEPQPSAGVFVSKSDKNKADVKIEDFGAKLEGAKKHNASFRESLSDKTIDTEAVPLSKSFPQPDYEKLATSGVPHDVLALVARVRGEIKTKPRIGAKRWAGSVNVIREFANKLIAGEISIAEYVDAVSPLGSYIKTIPDVVAIANEILPSQIKDLASFKLDKHHYAVFLDEKNVDKWVVTDSSQKGGFRQSGKESYFDTKKEALAFIKSQVTTTSDAGKTLVKFDIWSTRSQEGFFVGKKLGARKYIELKRFDSVREAKDYIANNNDELVEMLAKKKQIGTERRAEQNERVGKDYRRGVNVTQDLFDQTFGFRGVQFGNYVENDRRQQDLNNAYDGLLDLADVLGIPLKAISLNGELGLAFGARGQGGKNSASAHYEPSDKVGADRVVINLTKGNGPGSLAHEWWHALDNYFARMGELKNRDGSYLTEMNRPVAKTVVRDGRSVVEKLDPKDFGVRPQVYDAFKGVVKAIEKDTKLYERSRELDNRRTKDYWTTTRELTARSFERFVIDELASKGYESDYLATILPENEWNANESFFGNDKESYPYPTDREAEKTNAAYSKLFDALETKETDAGVALYSLGDALPNKAGISKGEAQIYINNFTEGWKNTLIEIKAVSNIDDFPSAVKAKIEKDKFSNEQVKGIYFKGKIFINASAMKDRASVEKAIQHEVFGHYGLRALFGDKNVKTALTRLYMAIGGDKGLRDLAQKHGVDLSKYDELLKNGSPSERIEVMTDELLAHIAQDSRPSVKRWLQELWGAIRAWFRAQGLISMGNMTDSDIMNLLKKTREAARDVNLDGGSAVRILLDDDIDVTGNEYTNSDFERLATRQRMRQDAGRYSLHDDKQTRSQGGFSVSGLQEQQIVYGMGVDTILRVWQDKMRPLLRTQQAIEGEGKKISEEQNAYLAEEAFHGKTENDLRKMRERYLEPMAKKMAAYPIDREELDMYLWAKHAQERNEQIAKINPEMLDGGSGMTTEQANQILKQAKSEGNAARFEELSGIVYKLLDEKRKIMRQLAGDDMVDTWNSAYQFYVPLKGRAVDDSGGSFPRVGRGFDIRGKESLRALGRRTKPESPTLHSIKDTTEAIIRYRKNEVGNAFLALVEANPNPEYWEVFDATNPDFERKLLTKKGKDIVGNAKVINKEDYFITKRDGKEFYIRTEDPLLMRAMKNLGPEKMNWMVQHLAKVSRFLSSMVTSYNPEFVLTNFSRDIQTAVLNVQAEMDLHDGKVKGKHITGNMVKGVPFAMRAVYASLRNKKLDGEYAQWQTSFDDFRNDGANTGWFQLLDIEQQAKELGALIDMQKNTNIGKLLRAKKAIGDIVTHINSSVENAIRLSVYKSAVDAGITRKQAASLAKNVTVNFNRKGEVGASMNALYMFFNASVQGTAAFARSIGTLTIDENGKRKLNNAQKLAAGILVSSFGLALLNREIAGDDDDGENWWDKVPDPVKERNIVIMKSLWGGEAGEYITIPLPYGYNVFNALATSTDSAVNGKKGIGETSMAMLKALMGAFSPIGVAESNTFWGGTIRTIAPTAVKPIADLASNENFFGSKIFAENFEFDAQKPQSHLHLRSTNDVWVWASEFLNDSTGGSSYRSGLIDISPDRMGYLFNYFVGGAGQFYSRVVHLGIKGAQDREIEPTDIPFLRRFEGEVKPYPDQHAFYDRKEKIDQIVAERKSLAYGSDARADFEKKFQRELGLNLMVKATAAELTALRKKRNKISDDAAMSEKDKDEQLKPIEERMKAAVDRFNKAYSVKH